MCKSNQHNPVGRPRIEIDFDAVNAMCEIQCTGEEIASVLKVSYDTLVNRIKEETGLNFSDYYKKASASGKMSLRRAQFKKAVESGSDTMLIWLGKQYLGQREPKDMEPDDAGISKKMAEVLSILEDKKD